MKRRPDDRTPEEKMVILLKASAVDGEALGALLRSEGVRDGDLERWRHEAVHGLSGGTQRQTQSRRIRDLERENHRQKKRLREAEALLDLQKKVHAMWGAEDDDTTRK
jgi:transposase-like protein